MPRTAAKIDGNHKAIVSALRQMGATVQPLHAVGNGCPDIAVGYRGRNYLFEIKDGAKSPSQRKLTPDQETWHRRWNGQACVIDSADMAVWYLLQKNGHS